MPEGDTVRRTADRLNRALAGERLTVVDLRWPSVATAGGDLVGRTTLEVTSRGKHLLQRLEGGTSLHTHLRMDGVWRVAATGAEEAGRLGHRPETRAVVGTATWTAYGLRLGMVDVLPTREEVTLVGHLGPDILDLGEDRDEALRRLHAAPGPIAAALLDQRNVAGIGTLWASESLFLEHVHPWARVDPETAARVLDRAHRLMTAATSHPMQTSTGIRRQAENTHVHGRSGRPCRRCGDTVRVAAAGPPGRERTIFYCPTCQGGLPPHDDGSPQSPLGARRDADVRRRER